MGLGEARWLGKDGLVRALGHGCRDAGTLRGLFAKVGTSISLSFLAELVLCGRVRFVDLPTPVLDEYGIGPGVGRHPDCGHGLLQALSLVFIASADGAACLYVPDDVRRPYARALLALRPEVGAEALRRRLEAFIQGTRPPRPPWAPGLPTFLTIDY